MRAVLFDLFETLVSHFDPDWKPPLRTTAERLGIDQRVYDEHWPRLAKQWETGAIAEYEPALASLCAAAGVRADPRVLAELKRDYLRITSVAFVPPAPALVDMLRALRSRGLRLAIVSNATDLDAAPWPGHDLAPYFDTVVFSHQARLMKPDPRIYELACQRLGVAPGEALFVGDGGSDELRGASEAGIRPIWGTWFLDRWPEGIRPNGFPGDHFRRQRPSRHAPPFPRIARPEDLLASV